MTCRSCAHSEARPSMLAGGVVLWCARHRTMAQRRCGDFVYEPGVDE